MADHTLADRLAARKEKIAKEKEYIDAVKKIASGDDDRIELDLGGTTVSSTVTTTEGGVTTSASISTDGSSTFNLPDLQGRAPIGSGSGSGLSSRSLGATGGFESMHSGSNIGSGSDFSNSLMQPFSVVNFFIATGL